ncbi:Leucyl aminopeptidase yscIV [Madurella fahalii]|uniref:Peptide hydrolase n=1 Tax=Madurella fahalii TaxID=1157608 RepID=A0ABQ0G4H8_9PEZI
MRFTTASLLPLALPALVSAAGGGGPDGGHGGPGKKPLVDSEKLQSMMKAKDLLAGSQKLQDLADAHGGNRAFGSGGHNATVDYIYKTLKALNYYNVVKQPFTEIFSQGSSELTIGEQSIESQIMTYTPGGQATAPIVALANLGCTPADYPTEVAGNIALVSRGECTFGEKSLSAKAAGALAIVIYNNVEGSLAGTLGTPFLDYAPVVGISQEDGQAILEQLSQGAVTATLNIEATVEERVNFNVIAETKQGDHDNVLVVGGHSDSVAAGPGINDDGSGTIGILTVAKALAKFRVNNAIRFAFWGAEEFGLLGSYFYMNSINGSETEMAKIRAYLNFDMIASPNYILGIYDGDGNAFNLTGPAGSDVLERDFEEFFESNGFPSVPTEFSGRSDYAAFIENGIPSGGLFTGAEVAKTEEEAALFGGEVGVAYDVNYHRAGDTVDNLNMDAFLLNTKAIAHSVAKYARSFESLPAVNINERRWEADRAKMLKRNADRQGHGHGHKHSPSSPCGGGALI